MKFSVLCFLSLVSVFTVTRATVPVQYYMPTYGYDTQTGFSSFGQGGLFEMIIFLFVFILMIQLLFGAGSGGAGSSYSGSSKQYGSEYNYGYDSLY